MDEQGKIQSWTDSKGNVFSASEFEAAKREHGTYALVCLRCRTSHFFQGPPLHPRCTECGGALLTEAQVIEAVREHDGAARALQRVQGLALADGLNRHERRKAKALARRKR